jgi:hypothetical protein
MFMLRLYQAALQLLQTIEVVERRLRRRRRQQQQQQIKAHQ